MLLRIETDGNRPSVFVPNTDLTEKIENNYDVGENITILGNIQSSILSDKSVSNSIFAEDVLDTTTSLDLSTFYIQGLIVKISVERLFTKLIVRTDRGHTSFVPIVFYHRLPKNFAVGDKICVSGSIQTKVKFDNDGNKIWYQNYVAR